MKQETQKRDREVRLKLKEDYRSTGQPGSKHISPDKFKFYQIKTTKEQPVKERLPLTKRLSPFLILIGALTILFPYMMITGTGNIHNFWLLLFLFPCIVCNLFLADVAIWKYFSAKKAKLIWITELTLSMLLVYMLI